MSKKDYAMRMALDWYDSGNENPDDFANMIKQVIALAQQQAQGCDYCTHPQYAGTKYKNCGREQPAQPSKPWVGLTDDEIDECYYWKDRQWTTDELVLHVETKLREKNA